MSLPRKDARFYLDAEMHAALVAVCEARGVPLSDQVERLVVNWVFEKVTEASLIASATAGLGISRKSPDTPGNVRRTE